MDDKLATYRSKRAADRTPEPVPAGSPAHPGADDTFVIQEHHARRLHWDFRLERSGVLVSWALPKGLPDDPRRNHLAVQTEDHPLEYGTFAGTIPAGQYGAGSVTVWDHGHYDCEKWTDDEIKIELYGDRAAGRFTLIHTGDKNWLIHRMKASDPTGPAATSPARTRPALTPPARPAASRGDRSTPDESGRQPMPTLLRPMLATAGKLPDRDGDYAYETKWDGVRAIAYLSGGVLRLLTRNDADVTDAYPELAPLGSALGNLAAILDGEIVAFDRNGRASFGELQPRMHLRDQRAISRLAQQAPVQYCIFDLLYLDGHSTVELAWTARRELLQSLGLTGQTWQTPPHTVGGGAAALGRAVKEQSEGIMAKRLDSRYTPGRRSPAWIKIKNFRTQEVVIGGWRPGQGARADTIGSLLLGIPGPDGLTYVGQVGTGFTRDTLADLQRRLSARSRKTSPFADVVPTKDTRDATWITPQLVGEVRFTEWTRDGRLRHPSWRGLRPDKAPSDVVRE